MLNMIVKFEIIKSKKYILSFYKCSTKCIDLGINVKPLYDGHTMLNLTKQN